MNADPGILCFQHCNAKIFTFNLPENCPLCNHKILQPQNDSNNVGILPFRIPFPFVRATQTQCSVVLRPTVGDFLNNYNNSTDLHIAVTTSEGNIVEFDRGGLNVITPETKDDKWEQTLTVTSVPEEYFDHWDETLFETKKQPLWNSKLYNKDTHNCYSFVLAFLQTLNHRGLSRLAMNRMLFCEKIIVPKTVVAAKYISLYRKIRDSGCYVHLSSQHEKNKQK